VTPTEIADSLEALALRIDDALDDESRDRQTVLEEVAEYLHVLAFRAVPT
jgi:uncharacterized protein YgfB (UPF0149 family)